MVLCIISNLLMIYDLKLTGGYLGYIHKGLEYQSGVFR